MIITTSIFYLINTVRVRIPTGAADLVAIIRTPRERIDLTCRTRTPKMSVKCAIVNSSICRSNSNCRIRCSRPTDYSTQVPLNPTSTWITRILYGEAVKEPTTGIFAYLITCPSITRPTIRIARNLRGEIVTRHYHLASRTPRGTVVAVRRLKHNYPATGCAIMTTSTG